MLKAIIGTVILLVGLAAFVAAIGDIPQGVGFNFLVGWFLPSTLIIAVGVVVLAWKSKKKG